MRWHGGAYGELPYLIVGDTKYYIKDAKFDNSYKYCLKQVSVSNNGFFKKEYKLIARRAFEFQYSLKLFRRYYQLRYGKPLEEKYLFFNNCNDWDYKKGNLCFWGREKHHSFEIGCYNEGQTIACWFDTMDACKQYAEKYFKENGINEKGQYFLDL